MSGIWGMKYCQNRPIYGPISDIFISKALAISCTTSKYMPLHYRRQIQMSKKANFWHTTWSRAKQKQKSSSMSGTQNSGWALIICIVVNYCMRQQWLPWSGNCTTKKCILSRRFAAFHLGMGYNCAGKFQVHLLVVPNAFISHGYEIPWLTSVMTAKRNFPQCYFQVGTTPHVFEIRASTEIEVFHTLYEMVSYSNFHHFEGSALAGRVLAQSGHYRATLDLSECVFQPAAEEVFL